MAIARVITPVRTVLALTVTALLLGGTPATLAAQRFASPSATNTGPDCTAPGTSPGPCQIRAAVVGAQSGDEVIVEPGDYKDAGGNPMTDNVLTNHPDVTIHAATATLPRLFFGGTAGVAVGFPGDSISGLDIEASGGDPAFAVSDGATADRMFVHSSGGSACSADGPISDSVCWMDGGTGDAMIVSSDSTAPVTLTLRNDTIESTVDFGLYVTPGSSPSMTLNAINVIAHGTSPAPDVLVKPAGTMFAVTVNMGYSNFVTHIIGGTVTGGTFNESPPGSNQATPPAFVNPASGDFRELASSTGTIDRGHDDGDLGPLDLEAGPRVLGAAPDIGAYEFIPPVPGPTPPAPVALASVSRLGMSPSAFAAASKGPSAITAAAKRSVGSRVSYALNEPATVRFTVQRREPGRKVRHGKKTACQRPGRNNRRDGKCTRFVTLRGGFTVGGKAGANRFRFTGRLRGKKLKPGRYRLVARPSVGGRTGRAASVSFRITA